MKQKELFESFFLESTQAEATYHFNNCAVEAWGECDPDDDNETECVDND